jgi:replicative DNA helicase
MATRAEIEYAIAGCLLINGGNNANIVDINITDFITPIGRLVMKVLETEPIIDIMVCRAYANRNNINVNASELSAIINTVPTSKNLPVYVRQLKKAIYTDKLNKLRAQAAQDIKNSKDMVETAQLIAYEEHALRLKYLEIESSSSLFDCCADLISRIEARQENDTLVKTGWKMLDELHGGGFLPNELIVIAARPSIGKTAAAIQLAANGDKGVFFALEMDNAQIAPRLLAMTAKQNTLVAARNPAELSDEVRDKLLENSAALLQKASKIIVYDDHDQNISTIRRRARKEVDNGARFVIIDYLQLLEDEKAQNRERAIAKMSRACKNMAKELSVPVFLLAQLNRACETERRAPRLSDLRESGAIEQDANSVIFLYDTFEKFAKADGSPSNRKRVIFKLAKGRDVGNGIKQAIFEPDHQTFYEEKLNPDYAR